MSKKRTLSPRKRSIELEQADKLMSEVADPVIETRRPASHSSKPVKGQKESEGSRPSNTPKSSGPDSDVSVAFSFTAKNVILAFPRGATKFENRSLRLSQEVLQILSSKKLGMSESQVAEQLIRLGLIKLKEFLDKEGAFVTTDLLAIPDDFTHKEGGNND